MSNPNFLKKYRNYILFQRADERLGLDLLYEFIRKFQNHKNATELAAILSYHHGKNRSHIQTILIFFTPTDYVDGKFVFYKKKKKVEHFQIPSLPPNGGFASYNELASVIILGKYHDRLNLLILDEEKKAEAARDRERKRLYPRSSGPIGRSVRTISGGLPSLGKRR